VTQKDRRHWRSLEGALSLNGTLSGATKSTLPPPPYFHPMTSFLRASRGRMAQKGWASAQITRGTCERR
jgi:hypothetical protein